MKQSFEAILKDIDQKKFSPVYFLSGEESYFVDEITGKLEKEVIPEEQQSFNMTTFYGRDANVQDIIGTAKRFPMMADHNLVIVKEAQFLKQIDEIKDYVENPQPSTVLVIAYKNKKPDGRKGVFKALQKNAVYFESPRIYDNQIPQWIEGFCKTQGTPIHPKAAVLLAEYLGSDLQKIVNELKKLTILLEDVDQILPAHIEKHVGINKEYNLFELNNAIGAKNLNRANRIALFIGQNEKNYPIQVVIATLYNYFSKILSYHYLKDKSKMSVSKSLGINPFFVKEYQIAASNYSIRKCVEIISYLRKYDMQSKGVGNISASNDQLLKELIYLILH